MARVSLVSRVSIVFYALLIYIYIYSFPMVPRGSSWFPMVPHGSPWFPYGFPMVSVVSTAVSN